MDQAARAHDLWMTLAQVIPVVALAYGVIVSNYAKRRRDKPISRRDHLGNVAFYGLTGLVLAVCWVASLFFIVSPIPWMDYHPELLFLTTGSVGAFLMIVPTLEYFYARPPKKRGEHAQ